MPYAATIVPHESDLLCEGCGYTLNGLPTTGNCPECGKPIHQSIGTHREYTEFEITPSLQSFLRTSVAVLFRPTRFYRTLTTRGDETLPRRFAFCHWLMAAVMAGIAGQIHLRYHSGQAINPGPWGESWFRLGLAVVIWFVLYWTTRLAAKLSAWEAAYRGIRLPLSVVRRGLYFHAPHYLPVAAVALVTVVVDWYLLNILHIGQWQVTYLVVLCAEVVIGAVYLFVTYWIGMKNMMYANR